MNKKKLIKILDYYGKTMQAIGKKVVLSHLKKYKDEEWLIHNDNGYTYTYNLKQALDEMYHNTLNYSTIWCDKYAILIKKIKERTYIIERF